MLLKLHPESIAEAQIPTTYFSMSEPDFNSSALVEMLSSVPNSPLTPGGLIQGFPLTIPNATFSNYANIHDMTSKLTPANLRFHAMQQQSLQQEHISTLALNGSYTNVSPRSVHSNTSGYLSQLGHISSPNNSGASSSLDFQQPEHQTMLSTPSNNLCRRFNQGDFDHRLLTPNYQSVSMNKE